MTTAKSDFMAAEEIKGILHGRDKVEQERIIRWVNESLGLATVPTAGSGITGALLAPTPHSAPPTTLTAHPAEPARPKDIRSFVGEKQPKSDVQFAAVAAYFNRFVAPQATRRETITPAELDDAGRQARGCGFKKPLVTLSNARQLGYFDRAGRAEFRLNAVGENLVAMALPSTGTDNGGTGRGTRKVKRPTRGVNRRSKPKQDAAVKRSKMSVAGRARIVAAQKARWAKIREAKSAPAAKL
jgi:hypothetical protein